MGLERANPHGCHMLSHPHNSDLAAARMRLIDETFIHSWTKVILQHLQTCNHHLQDLADTHNEIRDSGVLVCITNDKKDFIGPIKKTQNGKVNGISGAMDITRSGKSDGA